MHARVVLGVGKCDLLERCPQFSVSNNFTVMFV